jgi:hypothetical protein
MEAPHQSLRESYIQYSEEKSPKANKPKNLQLHTQTMVQYGFRKGVNSSIALIGQTAKSF